jgi:hypothetical protein
MLHLIRGLCAIVVLYRFPQSLASIGPVDPLIVANKNIEPDGFSRPCVILIFVLFVLMALQHGFRKRTVSRTVDNRK